MVERVRETNMPPMQALVSAQSFAAEAVAMAGRIGSIGPGCDAGIIGVEGRSAPTSPRPGRRVRHGAGRVHPHDIAPVAGISAGKLPPPLR